VRIVGLIPAAGLAKRLAPLPFSKELYPIGVHQDGRPKVVTHYLLDKMRAAGISKVFVVLREGKWDIPAYFGSGSTADVELAYLLAKVPYGPPYTLDAAHSFVQDSIVAFGFPDILFEGDAAFTRLLQRRADSAADVVLGLFPTDRPEIMDMVRLDDDGRVDDLLIRPQQTDLTQCWAIAVWTPAFTRFLHEHLRAHSASAGSSPESTVGHVIRAAVRAGLSAYGVSVSNRAFHDIGTPDGLAKALAAWQHPSSAPNGAPKH
jgi:glucose-1-phosphate thymidylyltransferase